MLWEIKRDSYDRCVAVTCPAAVSQRLQWCCLSDEGVSKLPPANRDTEAAAALEQFSFLTSQLPSCFLPPCQCCDSGPARPEDPAGNEVLLTVFLQFSVWRSWARLLALSDTFWNSQWYCHVGHVHQCQKGRHRHKGDLSKNIEFSPVVLFHF